MLASFEAVNVCIGAIICSTVDRFVLVLQVTWWCPVNTTVHVLRSIQHLLYVSTDTDTVTFYLNLCIVFWQYVITPWHLVFFLIPRGIYWMCGCLFILFYSRENVHVVKYPTMLPLCSIAETFSSAILLCVSLSTNQKLKLVSYSPYSISTVCPVNNTKL